MLINGVEYSMGRPVGPWTQETWTEFVKRLDEITIEEKIRLAKKHEELNKGG